MHTPLNKAFKSIIIVLTATLLANCGGHTGSPVMVSQYGDDKRSCSALEFEMKNIQAEMQKLSPQTDKTTKNVLLGTAGVFLLVPWFFMDFKNGEKAEYEAYRQRYMNLAMIATDKKCDIKTEKYPSSKEIEQNIEKQKETSEKVKN